ncbi:uncharacterized protein K460DRAFT_373302 [Cucurbitaria berberidis CBS 394.84]|uniref:C2H2-type domain-containing protein n=1 Tax=Cucurbitaria berberidis CBS 394.84 TaxID=1168544 RepID=A0A9P4LEN4_9PLEO|nr:uncharacterized protein K460DRAFT_373302 [Cucurbitaria berberidis CBS 394.84]KAF1851254.1 hypothetical protein K460DRAFT_373302 [Cucurbitaria berberidis CBS 394.84]
MNGTISEDLSHVAPEFGPLPRYNTGFSTILGNDQNGHWSERNLLSLDGGGIRGYWSLLVLERLMQAIGDEERKQGGGQERFDSFHPEPLPDYVTQRVLERSNQRRENDLDAQSFLPCHSFDVICGSSTGSQRIFGKPRWVSQRSIGIVRWPKYNAVCMEEAFKDVTQRRGEKPSPNQHAATSPLFPTSRGTCSMSATTMLRTEGKRGSSKKLHLFRSYNHKNRDDISYDGEIQVARAATAAPLYFTELQYKFNSEDRFGLTNNPTLLGIQEIENLFGQDRVGVILSVGIARDNEKPGKKGILHRHVANSLKRQTRPYYWRLNDKNGLDLELDDWKPNGWFTRESLRGHKPLEKITNGFNAWAMRWESIQMIQQTAEQLFRCLSNECQDAYSSRGKFNDHWREFHEGYENADRYRDPEFTVWVYPAAN